MRKGNRALKALCVAIMLAGMANVPGLNMTDSVGADDRGPVPHAGDPVWSDTLDDSSHVYVPAGGLQGVEVVGGEVRLLAGYTEGWVASEVIECPSSYRYDLAYIEADLPGGSSVKITVLDPTKEPSEVGYANETIPGYVKEETQDLSLFGLDYNAFPRIRIQVNLVASGTDRPTLLTWSVFFIGLEEWRDDFYGTSKMFDWDRLNFTGGDLEVNLSRKGGGSSVEYEKLPTIMAVDSPWQAGGDIDVIYRNAGVTGYNDPVSLDSDGACGFAYGDLNGDGYLDMIVPMWGSSGNADSQIYWGQSSGTWTRTGALTLTTDDARKAQVGDFNADGELDFVIVCDEWGGSADQAMIWLNGGSGSFTATADITITTSASQGVDTGDVNGDGYDDIILAENNGCRLFLGGPSGPSTTAYRTYTGLGGQTDVLMMDLDLDGYLDIAFPGTSGGGGSPNGHVFLGAADGPDTTEDYTVNTGGAGSVNAGDINGDGYIDLVFGSSNDVKIYEGDASGWSDTRTRTLAAGASVGDVKCRDLDQDGYADIVCAAASNPSPMNVLVWFGKSTWPTTADITKTAGALWQGDLGVAMPKANAVSGYRGTFTTDPIYIAPEQKWDILLLEGTMPQNTTVSISILDGAAKEITGWKELTDWNLDLSPLTGQSPIMVKVTAASEFNWTTPVLDRISVKWMAKGYWREQFYGPAKIERKVNVGVTGGELARAIGMGTSPQLLVTSLRNDAGYASKPQAFIDGGGLDYLSLPPITFEARGVGGADAADVNGDGILDVVFAVQRISDTVYDSPSLLFLGTAVGFRSTPERSFPTVGATDVLLQDLNGDGRVDIVFAQQTNGLTPRLNSSLYWGLAGGGWADKPDQEFETNGAAGVVAVDFDGDGKLDLAFACMEDTTSTSTNSMVFLQEATGFCGTVPSSLLPTKKARAVAVGDLNGDGRQDLVFANSFWAGSVEIDSYIYWGVAGGGFDTSPSNLKTVGAEDVKVADLDGDGDLDVVFANMKSNTPAYTVDSYVYLNGGSGAFPTDPSSRMLTTGAVAVAVADLDGTGRKDLVFACQQNETSFNTRSRVFLGGATGWSYTPDLMLPTVGASDVLAPRLISAGTGGYMSKVITPEDPPETGAFHTFRYTAGLGAQQAGKLQLVDATTWAVLAETALQDGTHEWVVKDLFWVKEHPRIRAVVSVTGLDKSGTFTLDELYLNWTKRIKEPPMVLDLGASPTSLLRMKSGTLWVNVTDEYDPAKDLRVVLEHRLNGSTTWNTYLFGPPTFSDGSWRVNVFPRADAAVGMYDVRVNVTDGDDKFSGHVVFESVLEVLNNVPTKPVVRIVPEAPLTTTSLRAEIDTPATDVETGVVYRYRWFKDGELVDTLTEDTVTSAFTSRHENWSVEVRAFDGIDEGPPALAWVLIHNAPPQVAIPLPNPEMAEDTVDNKWLDLGRSFSDPDGDALTYTVTVVPKNITVTIDPATGVVTLAPKKDWHGQETATFVASDGELTQTQTVLITVTPVNDAPRFTTLNEEPITTDPVDFEVVQGGLLVITVGAEDVEGDELAFQVNSTAVEVNPATGEMRFRPGNDVVGTVRFALTMYDLASPNVKVKVNITIKVLNANDPPGDARITNPPSGEKFKVNQTFSLIGTCTDPDIPYGQVLNYTWWWNGTNLLGYGSSLTVFFERAGNYTITLNVTDGEYFREAHVSIEVTPRESSLPPPPPPPPDEEEGLGAYLWIGILVVLVVVGGVIFLVISRRRAQQEEAAEEEEEKREALQRMAVAARETAEQMEREMAESKATRAAAPKGAELEEIKVEGMGGPSAKAGLSMEARVTEQASKEVQALFATTPATAVSTEDTDTMRLESLKRKYQTAISRLPYGIPSEALKDKDWPWLASALATGEKKTLPDGREVTQIEGHWYYSDVKDASSFLKEHGAKARPKPKAAAPAAAAVAPAVDKTALLAKLEERFILGQISEKAYEELKRKYQAEIEAEKADSAFEWEEEPQ